MYCAVTLTAEKNCFQESFKIKAIKTVRISKFIWQRVSNIYKQYNFYTAFSL